MITIVVSVYNTGKYLPRFMHSLSRQTCKDHEVIIVDDGSTDSSSEICDSYADTCKVIHQDNQGLSGARNTGLKHATGDFIIFPDPDDWLEESYLETLLKNSDGNDLSICSYFDEMDGRQRKWDVSATRTVLTQKQAMKQAMLPSSFQGYAWNKLYRMDIIRQHNLQFDTSLGMAQDLHFAICYLMHCKQILYDPIPLYHYNHDSGGVTASYTPLTKRKLSCLLTYRKIIELTNDTMPQIADIARCSLCNTALQYIYIYFRTHMHDPQVLDLLQKTYIENEEIFLSSETYARQDKMFSNIVKQSPYLYASLTRFKKIILNRFDPKIKRQWKKQGETS